MKSQNLITIQGKMSSSLDNNQILSSMVHEWKLVARHLSITSVALAALNCVNVRVFNFLRWPCTLFGIYKTCAIYEVPRDRQNVLPAGRIAANIVSVVVLMVLLIFMLTIKADMNDIQKERYGPLLQANIEFLNAMNLLVVVRAIYLVVDNYVYPGALDGITAREFRNGNANPTPT